MSNYNPFSKSFRPRARPEGLASRSEISSFKFPIEDQQDYKGKITFIANQEETSTLQSQLFSGLIGEQQGRGAPPGPGPGATTIGGKAGREAVAAAKGNPAFKTIITPIPKRIGSGRKCSLYLPASIQFQDRVEYTNIDLGIVGASTAAGIASGMSGKDILKSIGGAALPDFESVQDAFNQGLGSEAAQVAALRVAKNLSSGVQGAIETSTGIALNPNRRSTLKGVGLRQFRFAFKLIPTTAEEANMIKAIVKFFREEMYPEARYISAISAAYRFPSKFTIKLSYDKKQVATSILPSFLESIDVVYNPNAMAFHTDGNPQETDISLSFIEERTLNKADVAEGGY
jgi:hypothetical protein